MEVCKTIGAWVLCKWKPGTPSIKSGVKKMLLSGSNITGSFIIRYFERNLDKILIGWRYGANQLGYYHKAYYLFTLPTTQLTTALQSVAIATLSKTNRQQDQFHNYYIILLKIYLRFGIKKWEGEKTLWDFWTSRTKIHYGKNSTKEKKPHRTFITKLTYSGEY